MSFTEYCDIPSFLRALTSLMRGANVASPTGADPLRRLFTDGRETIAVSLATIRAHYMKQSGEPYENAMKAFDADIVEVRLLAAQQPIQRTTAWERLLDDDEPR